MQEASIWEEKFERARKEKRGESDGIMGAKVFQSTFEAAERVRNRKGWARAAGLGLG